MLCLSISFLSSVYYPSIQFLFIVFEPQLEKKNKSQEHYLYEETKLEIGIYIVRFNCDMISEVGLDSVD